MAEDFKFERILKIADELITGYLLRFFDCLIAVHNLANFHIAFRSLNFHDILIKLPKSRLKKTGDYIFPFDFLNSRMRWSYLNR